MGYSTKDFSKRVEGTSKGSKAPKKKKQVEQSQVVEEDIVKEIIPMKTRVLKQTKKPAKKPSNSPTKTSTQDPFVESVEPTIVDPSVPVSYKGGPKKVRKLEFSRREFLFVKFHVLDLQPQRSVEL